MRDFPPQGPEGACWTSAALQAGTCANVLKDQSKLALAFTNCHLQQSGRPLAPMPQHMSDATFAIYTEFFTHTADLCFHLQGEHYHEKANQALDKLTYHATHYFMLLNAAKAIAGVLVILIMGKAAKIAGVPQVDYLVQILVGSHIVVCAIGWYYAIAAAALLAFYRKRNPKSP